MARMTRVEGPQNADSEMEEGEIVDDLDYLSDISSEEEFLLRQRLQVLENYNNVLERKKAKRSLEPGIKHKAHSPLPDLSEISATELEENYNLSYSVSKTHKHNKTHHKQRRKKDHILKVHVKEQNIIRDGKKKIHRNRKKVADSSDSSDETGSEYRNKRRKLANAVIVNKNKVDKTSLSARLKNMLGLIQDSKHEKSDITHSNKTEIEDIDTNENNNKDIVSILPTVSSTDAEDLLIPAIVKDKVLDNNIDVLSNKCELIDLCSDDDKIVHDKDCLKIIDCQNNEVVNDKPEIECQNDTSSIAINNSQNKRKSVSDKDSDDDLELLRQNALQTKSLKVKTPIETENKALSDDEDSDTAELRLICLKSALLKKAIEMKQKQKMQKKLSQSSLHDDFLIDKDIFPNKINSDNNTDIESVDMDIGSDGEEKNKEPENNGVKNSDTVQSLNQESNQNLNKDALKTNMSKEEDFDEDEDLLRAKLLTSLSKNLPNLVSSTILDAIPNFKPENIAPKLNDIKKVPEEKRFIIKLGESDSEGEHEATKNLTKMHMKLSETLDFQQKLDSFLKTTRMEVEKSSLPDVIQENTAPKKTTEKYVAKAVKHLPKPEQIEYRNLVKRMAELEKIKQSRQVIHIHKTMPPKETLKPRNISLESQKSVDDNILEERIAMSRKKIAEESAKMLKLKEEATKLSQKYKIVATELRNIATAITLNKKQQKFVQNGLNKIRLQHQTLLRSNTITKHTQGNLHITLNNVNKKNIPTMKLQKENDPSKDDHKNQNVCRTVKLTTNDSKDEIHGPSPRISVQVDVASNKKVVKLPISPDKEKHIDLKRSHPETETNNTEHIHSHNDIRNEASHPVVENGGHTNIPMCDNSIKRRKSFDDYKSPLQSLESSNWRADPHAILCPFEVGGECKDSDCKYLHTKIITQ